MHATKLHATRKNHAGRLPSSTQLSFARLSSWLTSLLRLTALISSPIMPKLLRGCQESGRVFENQGVRCVSLWRGHERGKHQRLQDFDKA
jgi:hypothetical protein